MSEQSTVRLLEFLMNGQLGPIALDMGRDQVHNELGTPEDWGTERDRQRAEIWKYGSLQVYFANEKVWLIGIYYDDDEFCLPEALIVKGYFPTAQTTLDEFKAYLHQEDIVYRVDPKLTFGSQVCLALGLSVEVLFSSETKRILKVLVGSGRARRNR